MSDLELIILWLFDLVAYLSIYLVATISLNFQFGYTGIPNFGLLFSIAIGAYTTGALTGRLAMWYYGIGNGLDYIMDNTKIITMLNARLSNDPLGGIFLLFITILVSMLFSAALGFIASFPAIRLKEDYLLMILIAMGEAVRIIGTNYTPLVGGTLWVSVPNLFAWTGLYSSYVVIILMIITAILTFIFVQVIVTSPFGRLIRAMREDETAIKFLGKDIIKIKIIVMMLGSSLASLSGILFSLYTGSVIASAFTRVDWTFWPWLMLMIGGKGNNIGAFIGTISVISARKLIIFIKHDFEVIFPFSVVWLEQIFLGITLILFIIFRPQGLLPEKPTKIRGINYKKIALITLKKKNLNNIS
jgi:branched-chain amino acid transport system permease protein